MKPSTLSPAEEKTLNKLDAEIRAGHAQRVYDDLSRLRIDAVSRAALLAYATLARRVGLPLMGVRWLRRVVRPPRTPVHATPQETIEYAACLTRLGCVDEARALLAPVDQGEYPRAAFELGAALVAEWRYDESLAHFARFARSPGTTDYDRAVARANIAAGLVFVGDSIKAGALLRELLHDMSLRGNHLLLANVFRLTAICLAQQRKFDEAEKFLESSARYLKQPLDEADLRRYRAIFAVFRGKESAADELAALGKCAEAAGHWELARDTDRILALWAKDHGRLLKVYFGSPHAQYRAQLEKKIRGITFPERFDWAPEGGAAFWLDVAQGCSPTGSLAKQTALHRALLALSSDFYHPVRLATLFSLLHPMEHFHPSVSRTRIHQTIRGLRGWLAHHAPGVSIEETDGAYHLKLSGGWGLRVPREKNLAEQDLNWARLRELAACFGTAPFTSVEAAAPLGTSARNALRVLKFGLSEGRVVSEGRTASTRYRFV